MRSKSNIRNIILILNLNIVFLFSLWNCGDKFEEVCEKYPLLLTNLHKYNQGNDAFEKMTEPVNKMGEKLWALFEITLTDEFSEFLHSQELLTVDFIRKIINKEFLKQRDCVYSCFLDVSNNSVQNNNKDNLVYLFVSDINTVIINVVLPYKNVSLFRGVKGIKKVKVMYSNCPQKESHFKYVGYIQELFRDCTNLEEVNLENLNLNYLEVGALFAGCENLKEVKLQRTPFAEGYENDDNESIGIMFACIFYGGFDNRKILQGKNIKVSCTDQLCYELINSGKGQRGVDKVEIKSYYEDNNKKIVISNNEENELKKDSTYYRDFHIYLDELNQLGYRINKDEV